MIIRILIIPGLSRRVARNLIEFIPSDIDVFADADARIVAVTMIIIGEVWQDVGG